MGGGTQGGALISDTSTLGDYLRLVRRRKWIILQAVVLVPLAVLAFTLTQDDLYQGEAQVLLEPEDATEQILGSTSSRQSADELDRDASTQADVAHGPVLARRVLRDVPKAVRRRRSCSTNDGRGPLGLRPADLQGERPGSGPCRGAGERVCARVRPLPLAAGRPGLRRGQARPQRRIEALGGSAGPLADE